jgi:hypothetical protein
MLGISLVPVMSVFDVRNNAGLPPDRHCSVIQPQNSSTGSDPRLLTSHGSRDCGTTKLGSGLRFVRFVLQWTSHFYDQPDAKFIHP